MKYYVMTYSMTITTEVDNFQQSVTLITAKHPYSWLIRLNGHNEDADRTYALTFFAEISEAEYILFKEEERLFFGESNEMQCQSSERMQFDAEYRKKAMDVWNRGALYK